MKMGRPQCVCSPDCSHISQKHAVCGSDGKSYKDECTLLLARCMGHPDLEVMYQGECKSKQGYLIYEQQLNGNDWCVCVKTISLLTVPPSCLTQNHAPTWCAQVPTPVWLTRPTVLTVSRAAQLLVRSPCHLSRQSVAMTTSLTPVPATSAGQPASLDAPLESAIMATATVRIQKTPLLYFLLPVSNSSTYFVFLQVLLGNLKVRTAVRKMLSRGKRRAELLNEHCQVSRQ